MEIVVATTNNHKLQELRKIMPKSFKFTGIRDIGFSDEIPETGDTFEANALQKARFIQHHTKHPCLADDSGLEVKALGGKPGIYSARYAGPDANSNDNIKKLLNAMNGFTNRTARFKTVLALILDKKEYIFEGTVSGRITDSPSGYEGFGYDPVFIPDGYTKTFSEMTPEEKNLISHRAEAANLLRKFLENSGSDFSQF